MIHRFMNMKTRSVTRAAATAVVEIANIATYSSGSGCKCDNHPHPHNNIVEPTITDKYEVDINFDEASKAWKMNKKNIGFGSYKYTGCIYKFKNGHMCGKETVHDTNYCLAHLARTNIDKQVIDIVKKLIDATHK